MLKPTENIRVDDVKPGQFIEVGLSMFTILSTKSDYDGLTTFKLTTMNTTLNYLNITMPSTLRLTVYTDK